MTNVWTTSNRFLLERFNVRARHDINYIETSAPKEEHKEFSDTLTFAGFVAKKQ